MKNILFLLLITSMMAGGCKKDQHEPLIQNPNAPARLFNFSELDGLLSKPINDVKNIVRDNIKREYISASIRYFVINAVTSDNNALEVTFTGKNVGQSVILDNIVVESQEKQQGASYQSTIVQKIHDTMHTQYGNGHLFQFIVPTYATNTPKDFQQLIGLASQYELLNCIYSVRWDFPTKTSELSFKDNGLFIKLQMK